jgi:hypothetical protein
MMTREWEVRAKCRVWRGRYVIRGDVGRIAGDIAKLQENRFPQIKAKEVPLRVAIMSVLAVLSEECREDGVTAAELSFLLTTCLGRPVAPVRIKTELEALDGLIWQGEWGGEALYVLEKRGLEIFDPQRLAHVAKHGCDADPVARVETTQDLRGAEEGSDGQEIDPSIIARPAPHVRYRLV